MAASAPSQYESTAPPRSSHVHSTPQPFNSLLHHYSSSSQGSPNGLTDSPLGSSLDLSPKDSHIRARLLQDPIFPALKDDAVDLDSPEQLQAQDPLGAQLWKLFSSTKAQLPNSDRFLNITWRMMHMNLKRLESQQPRLVPSSTPPRSQLLSPAHSHVSSTTSARPPFIQHPSAPSGIAQLRKASDHQGLSFAADSPSAVAGDPMNLDDFLVPNSIASPAALSPSPSVEKMNNSSAAIPIRKQPFNPDQASHLSRTAPIGAPVRRESEFGYEQRHVRKTSIDERRVRLLISDICKINSVNNS